AQDSKPAASTEDETNLDTELYLILATNQQAGEGKIPASLDQVVKQLRNTLPFKNFGLTATLLNRVRSGGHLNLNWVGAPLLAPSSSTISTPSFNEFSIGAVKVVEAYGGQVIRLLRFDFGSRIPIQTSTNIASSGTAVAPVFIYEHIGLVTDISVREGEPAVVGTLNVGSSGDTMVIVIAAKRAPK
ncbi:MAG TPA: hypothetical protein VHD88_00585, partial [Pyrinomonadaceae bacterium]|nr:hypothetical protein [Pyrinomonadaceae bacterium]